jgi:hypothetical protein
VSSIREKTGIAEAFEQNIQRHSVGDQMVKNKEQERSGRMLEVVEHHQPKQRALPNIE